MVQFGRSSRSSWKESVRSSFGRTIMGKAIWESPIEVRMGEGFQLGMCIRTQWKRIILICESGWHQIRWKETKYQSDVESTHERRWFGRHDIIPWSCILGLHSTSMRSKSKYCGQLQNHVRIANFRRGMRETTIPSKYSYFLMVLWHGWSCKAVPRTIGTGTSFARDDDQNKGTIPMPTFAGASFARDDDQNRGHNSNADICREGRRQWVR